MPRVQNANIEAGQVLQVPRADQGTDWRKWTIVIREADASERTSHYSSDFGTPRLFFDCQGYRLTHFVKAKGQERYDRRQQSYAPIAPEIQTVRFRLRCYEVHSRSRNRTTSSCFTNRASASYASGSGRKALDCYTEKDYQIAEATWIEFETQFGIQGKCWIEEFKDIHFFKDDVLCRGLLRQLSKRQVWRLPF